MTKFFAICACGLVASNCVERALGSFAAGPIPDEYRLLWLVVAIGWALITYRVWAELQPSGVRG